MATKLKEFDFSTPSNLTKADEKAVYPWDDWFDGDIWQLTHGEDFDPHPLMMERIIRTRATGRKAKVKIRHLPLHAKSNGNDPTGIIVMERSDVVGPEQEKHERRSAAAKRGAAARKKKAAPSKRPKKRSAS